MTYVDLHHKLDDAPFKPFRIKMVNSTSYDILQPWMIIIGESSALIVTQVRKDDRGYNVSEWRTVSISHMLEFSDLDAKQQGNEKRSA